MKERRERCCILYIDDNIKWLKKLKTTWRNYQITVLTAQNLSEAIAMVQKYHSDIKLVLIDLLMPDPETGENGEKEGGRKIAKQIEKKLQELGKKVPIWCVTGAPVRGTPPRDKIAEKGAKIASYREFSDIICKPQFQASGRIRPGWGKETAEKIRRVCLGMESPQLILLYQRTTSGRLQLWKPIKRSNGEYMKDGKGNYVRDPMSGEEFKDKLLNSPICRKIIEKLISKCERNEQLTLTHEEILECRSSPKKKLMLNRTAERANQVVISRFRKSLKKIITDAPSTCIEGMYDPNNPRKIRGYKFNFIFVQI